MKSFIEIFKSLFSVTNKTEILEEPDNNLETGLCCRLNELCCE
ncbi:MAG: hypothetical protein K0S32_1705 [Bacteroidetes bacterium]|jgi:hypothetical protein|nr:hypothetical protein [Bacteroidota bacterium]